MEFSPDLQPIVIHRIIIGYCFIASCKIYDNRTIIISSPGASQRRDVQPVDGGVHSDLKEVAPADGAAIHKGGSGRDLIPFFTDVKQCQRSKSKVTKSFDFQLGISLLTYEQLQTEEMQEKIMTKVSQIEN